MKELLKIAAWGVVEKLMAAAVAAAVAVALQANRWLLLLIEFIKIYLHIDRAPASGKRAVRQWAKNGYEIRIVEFLNVWIVNCK